MKSVPVNNQPTSVHLNISDGAFSPCMEIDERKVSHLAKMFHDKKAIDEILRSGDQLVYQIRYYPFITDNSDMALGTTIIFPGKVGDEYHMTKGHFHERSDQPEVYHCVQGEGVLQMMTLEGEYVAACWEPGTITHIPPQFAHRVVNTGSTPLVFVAVFHVAAGHVYGPIEERGFRCLIVEQDGKATQIPNPRWG
ncbi:MAG TPA: glucose-6-phosphate isomerase family protein [Anaerolineaceae bacterium]|jgi:glucose-6-phosphate isomerase